MKWASSVAAIGIWLACAPFPAKAEEDQALRDVRILSADEMEGRAPGTRGSARARAFLLERFRQLGLKPAYAALEQPFFYTIGGERRSGVNLVGQIDGTGTSDKVLVVTAHYDHLGVRRGKVFNGADDNASGVAGLLAIAASFRRLPPEHTVIFAALDAEETGHGGARMFVLRPPLPLSRIGLNLNLDMLSKSSRGELYAAGGYHFPGLRPWLDRLQASAPVHLKQGHDGPPWSGRADWTSESDHHQFHRKGIPWVYFGVEDHAEYHEPTDDYATIPTAFFLKSIVTVVKAARLFDSCLDEDFGRRAR
jgi:Zn-dependent M28 family amino/carboxypeptidase